LSRALPALRARGLTVAPLVIALQARVAIGDPIGEALGAACVGVLIGERPGLTAPDSLGIYLTWNPTRGRTDAERNCISNIRPEGFDYDAAAAKFMWLVQAMFSRRRSGVLLKDEQPTSQDRLPLP
jgi:ethanolamine ammonia-lyase small subunit